MIYLLDTNVCVTYLRGKDALLKSRVLSHRPADIVLGSVVVAELYYGGAMSTHPSVEKRKVAVFVRQFAILPFDEAAAEVFGDIRSQLAKAGNAIGPYDNMIAATALANRVKLVTHNTAEFSRVPGLDLEDWQVP